MTGIDSALGAWLEHGPAALWECAPDVQPRMERSSSSPFEDSRRSDQRQPSTGLKGETGPALPGLSDSSSLDCSGTISHGRTRDSMKDDLWVLEDSWQDAIVDLLRSPPNDSAGVLGSPEREQSATCEAWNASGPEYAEPARTTCAQEHSSSAVANGVTESVQPKNLVGQSSCISGASTGANIAPSPSGVAGDAIHGEVSINLICKREPGGQLPYSTRPHAGSRHSDCWGNHPQYLHYSKSKETWKEGSTSVRKTSSHVIMESILHGQCCVQERSMPTGLSATKRQRKEGICQGRDALTASHGVAPLPQEATGGTLASVIAAVLIGPGHPDRCSCSTCRTCSFVRAIQMECCEWAHEEQQCTLCNRLVKHKDGLCTSDAALPFCINAQHNLGVACNQLHSAPVASASQHSWNDNNSSMLSAANTASRSLEVAALVQENEEFQVCSQDTVPVDVTVPQFSCKQHQRPVKQEAEALRGGIRRRMKDQHRKGSDAYEWHKYSHKTLRGKEVKRLYYSCAEKENLNCYAKKTVDRHMTSSRKGDVPDIVIYDGDHNHPPANVQKFMPSRQ